MAETDEEVPGMREAIDRRRKQLNLTPGAFASAAGLTGPGLAPVRKGYRRDYSDRTRFGVADALRWPKDWYERLLAGQDAAMFDVEIDLNSAAAELSPESKRAVLDFIAAERQKQQS